MSEPVSESAARGGWRVSRLHASLFRSLVDVTVDIDPDLTVLVGRNGVGKSNVIDALQFLADAVVQGLSTAIASRQGTGPIDFQGFVSGFVSIPPLPSTVEVELRLERPDGTASVLAYGFAFRASGGSESVVSEWLAEDGRLRFERKGTSVVRSLSRDYRREIAPDRLAVSAFGDAAFTRLTDALKGVRSFSPLPSEIRQLRPPIDAARLWRDGRNLYACWHELEASEPETAARVVALLRQIVPNVERVEAQAFGGFVILQAYLTALPPILGHVDGAGLSDGTLRSLALLVATHQQEGRVLTCVEEPELYLHPAASELLLEALLGAPHRGQLLITTQSPTLLDASAIAPSMLRVVDWQDGHTVVAPLSAEQVKDVQSRLTTEGELLSAGMMAPASVPPGKSLKPDA